MLLQSLITSRRLMALPASRTTSGINTISYFWIEKPPVVIPREPLPCPLWVKSGHWWASSRCPLYPRKQTSLSAIAMSAFVPLADILCSS